MTEQKNPLGPVGDNVRLNVTRLRLARGLTKKDLSSRVAALGRRIPPLGIARLEAGTRRVDVDDLAALAKVFNVEPGDLFAEVLVCRACGSAPPAGFTCNDCGTSEGARP